MVRLREAILGGISSGSDGGSGSDGSEGGGSTSEAPEQLESGNGGLERQREGPKEGNNQSSGGDGGGGGGDTAPTGFFSDGSTTGSPGPIADTGGGTPEPTPEPEPEPAPDDLSVTGQGATTDVPEPEPEPDTGGLTEDTGGGTPEPAPDATTPADQELVEAANNQSSGGGSGGGGGDGILPTEASGQDQIFGVDVIPTQEDIEAGSIVAEAFVDETVESVQPKAVLKAQQELIDEETATDIVGGEGEDAGGLLTAEEERANRALANAWSEATQETAQDVRELIPGDTILDKVGGETTEAIGEMTNPFAINQVVESGIEVGTTPTSYVVDNPVDTAQTAYGVGGSMLAGTALAIKQDPLGEGIKAGVGLITGTAAVRGAERAGDVARNARVARQSDGTVDFDEITTQKAAETGELPKSQEFQSASPEAAADFIEESAADNPSVVTQRTGGQTTFHGTQADFGGNIDVGEGASELPGLFTSPEASTIALQGRRSGISSLSDLKPRAPTLSGKSDRFLGLPGDRVDSIPEGRGGQGYGLRNVDTGEQVEGGLGRGAAKSRAADNPDVEVAPDETTSGYEFLTEEADTGTAYVKPTETRSSEIEAVFGPDSQFEKTGTVGVRVGRRQIPGTDVDIPGTGRTVPMDTYRRAGADADAPDVDAPDVDAPDVDADDVDLSGDMGADTGDVVDTTDIYRDITRRQLADQGTPYTPAPTFGGTGSGGGSNTSDPNGGGTITEMGPNSGEITPTSPSDPGGSGGSFTDPPGSDPPTGGGGSETTPPYDPPTSIDPSGSGSPTGGPTSGGPTSGGPTSGGPTSGGPTSGGPTSGGPTSGGPTSGGPTSGGPTSGGPTSGGATSGNELPDFGDDRRREDETPVSIEATQRRNIVAITDPSDLFDDLPTFDGGEDFNP